MLGFAVLALILILIMPIVSVIMISGVGSRVSDLERSIADLKDRITSLDEKIRHSGIETADLQHSGSAEQPDHRDERGELAAGEAVIGESLETFEPSPQVTPPPVTPRTLEKIERHEEESRETPIPADIPPLPEAPESYAPAYAAPSPAKDYKPYIVERSWLAERYRALLSWLLDEGNIWVTVGIMLFLAGFGLLFNYVHRRGWIPLELRLTGAAVAGIAITALGWRLRELRRTYALILQGGGIGVLYIVLVAGSKLGGPVIPVGGAVLGMLLLSAFTIVLALYQEFEPLALFALIGGYAAPILVSTGSQNFVALFSIHSLLNFEVFLISLFRDWRKTRWSGLLASFATGVAWGALRWRVPYFASVEPFLILFFLNYSATALIPLFSGKLGDVVKNIKFWQYERMDMPMTATIPFVLVFLQMAAASHTRYGVAITCLAVAAWHLALGWIVIRSERTRKIDCSHQLFLAYCVIFANIAIPFVFRQASASAIWAAEGAFLIAYAVKKESGGALVCGLLLHIAAFVIYNYGPYLHLPAHIYDISLMPAGLLDWRDETSPFLLTGLIFAVSALISSRFISLATASLTPVVRIRDSEFKMPRVDAMAYFFAAYGTVWWTFSAWHAAFVLFSGSGVTAFSVLCLGGAVGYALSSYPSWKANGVRWNAARIMAFPPLAVAFAGMSLWSISSALLPFYMYGGDYSLRNTIMLDLLGSYAINWPAFAAMFALGVLSYRSSIRTRLRSVTWGVSLFTFTLYTGVVWRFWANTALPEAWSGLGGAGYLAVFLPLSAATALLTLKRFDRAIAIGAYIRSSLAALCAMMALYLPSFIEFLSSAHRIPPFYVPLLNTMELRQFLYLATAAMLLNALPNERVRRIGLHYVLTFAAFMFLNNVAARSAVRYFDEYVSWWSMSGAPYFQGIIAILWGLASLAYMFCGMRYSSRPLWFIGAGLLALDILKLLAIDLRNSATIIRIFAFLLLGGFFLLIGWTAPLPPRDRHADKQDEGEVDMP
jgi:uncharacterized membrane protein